MKKAITYIIILGLGISVGYLLSSKSAQNSEENHVHATKDSEAEVWTCSMHPQIRQPEPGKCPICGMDLIPAGSEKSQANDPYRFEMTKEAIQLMNVQTTLVGNMASGGENQISVNGTIEADETTASSVVSHIPGRIERLYVSFTGQKIEQSDKVAEIYAPDLIAAQQELIEAKKMATLNPLLLEAAKRKLRQWKIDEDFIQKVLATGEIQETFAIRSPYSGVVTNKKVVLGDYIQTGEILFEVQDLNTLWVQFDLYEHQLHQIHPGTGVQFVTASLPGQTFRAEVVFIDPVIDANTRTANVRAEVENSKGLLKPAMFVKGQIITRKTAGEHLAVPKSAVLWTGERSVVYLKEQNTDIPAFTYREVELAGDADENYLIASGLESGDEIVTQGAFMLDASAQLKNKSSMMNRRPVVKGATVEVAIPDYRADATEVFKQQLEKSLDKYIKLKDALVESDPELAKEAASALNSSIQEIDMRQLEGEAHDFWMQKVNALMQHSETLMQSSEIEFQRQQFEFISESLIVVVKAYGIQNERLFVQHCPMAFNNQGADWISRDSFIANPYFGEQMLTCGSIVDTLQTSLNQ